MLRNIGFSGYARLLCGKAWPFRKGLSTIVEAAPQRGRRSRRIFLQSPSERPSLSARARAAQPQFCVTSVKKSRPRRVASRAAHASLVTAVALFVIAAGIALVSPANGNSTNTRQGAASTDAGRRTKYRINLELDFDARTFTGTQRVRWTNDDDRSVSTLYFHLYANVRRPSNAPARQFIMPGDEAAPPSVNAPDEPRLEVLEVRAVASDDDANDSPARPLAFTLENDGTVLRVALGDQLAAGDSTEIEIRFRGGVPEIDADETGLLAHVIQQVDAVLSDARETRRARDMNFSSRGTMLLGAAYPVLAVRSDDGDWQRRIEESVGRVMFAEIADYDVTINAPADVQVFTSGDERATAARDDEPSMRLRGFAGERLRGFGILASRTLRAEERAVGGVRVRSVFTNEHERTGRRALATASEAVQIYAARFGALPYGSVTVAEAPLVAGLGRADFSGLSVVASAYYVDFDSPAARNLPQLVREQRESLEDSFEWTIAQTVAHQWWGASVGNDPQRAPMLDGALASWSALHYFREAHGEERARQILDDQLLGVYEIYRTFGGEDEAANRPARDYRNSFQFAAIIHGKAALMFERLRLMLGEERFWTALRRYYEANRFEIAEIEDLRQSFVAEVPPADRRAVSRTFNRWLTERRGDEDVAPPNPQLVAALGIAPNPNATSAPTESSAPNRPKTRNDFVRLGRFFWRQMTRIR